ncbi:hypothetical protein IE53DRAFT_172402 [Violaceomyces palustris]|uniref:Uncharacterized protein n=1 Tax=Violaceomyces palustris TaxID=1673888 RepID=A0ACD0NSY0_9BASI|nr:hypothetical protein IE53DRAFT_172402 [Violaceomyces palustris]
MTSFPAFHKAQQVHMDNDRSSFAFSPELSQALSSQNLASFLPEVQASGATVSSLNDPTSTSNVAAKPAISKRMNARLQLAAALIEADNESQLIKAALYNLGRKQDGDSDIGPPPVPQPKLASQSAIFAPYRDGPTPVPYHQRVRAMSLASKIDAGLGADDVDNKRPSIDFLGVSLPTERRSSRAGSSVGLSVRQSRTESLLSGYAPERPASAMDASAKADVEELSDWGVEKFLSKEEREKIASGRRSRANSVAGIVTPFQGPSSARSDEDVIPGKRRMSTLSQGSNHDPSPGPGAALGAGRAQSDIISRPRGLSNGPDLSLLAKIKLYRERQENLPPSQWDGPGPTATKEEVLSHLTSPKKEKSSLNNDRTKPSSVLDGARPHSRSNSFSSSVMIRSESQGLSKNWDEIANDPSGTSTRHPQEDTSQPEKKLVEHYRTVSTNSIRRPLSTFGVTGDSWSDQDGKSENGDEASNPRSSKTSSVAFPAIQALSSATVIPSTDAPDGRNGDLDDEEERPTEIPRIAAPAPAPIPISDATSSLRLDEFGSVAGFKLASSDQLDSAFGGKRGSIIFGGERAGAVVEGNALEEEEMHPDGMAGIGSFSRSQSRRNSFMSTGLLQPWSAPGSQPGSGPPSRPGTPGFRVGDWDTPILARGAVFPEDPFAALPLGPSPFPVTNSPGPKLVDLPTTRPATPGTPGAKLRPKSMANLTTKQLQEIAKGAAFPEHYGIGGYAAEYEEVDPATEAAGRLELPALDDDILSGSGSMLALGNLARAEDGKPARIILGSLPTSENTEPDLSSADWGKNKKKWFKGSRLSIIGLDKVEKGEKGQKENDGAKTALKEEEKPASAVDDAKSSRPSVDILDSYAEEPVSDVFKDVAGANYPDVDDEYISPPRKGPLRPRGLDNRMPKTLVMPQPLQGTPLAPKTRLIEPTALPSSTRRQSGLYVPDGFVLHGRGGLPPMKGLQVQGASGPRPLFMAPGGDKKHERVVSEFEFDPQGKRIVQIPAAAPSGIGRRAAQPTTALFRNQLVQHEEEKEGWGWEMGTDAERVFQTAGGESDSDDVPLASVKKQKRAAKKAAKKALKEKKARKKARRERRAKRAQAEREGKSYESMGVSELSPDEDLDLSEDTEESEESTESETDESIISEDEKRWIDDQKPAGKLFGKSLLDVAEERKVKIKTKQRFYGQVDLEAVQRVESLAAARSTLGVPGADNDAASIAQSAGGRSFRENPIGTNDTRERMQATFGEDLIWSREMAKRREEEAREAEEREILRLAEEEFKREEEERKKRKKEKSLFRKKRSGKSGSQADGERSKDASVDESPGAGTDVQTTNDATFVRSKTPVKAPTIDLNLNFGDENDAEGDDEVEGDGTLSRVGRKKRQGPSEAAAEWFAKSSDEEDSDESTDSEDEAERRKAALARARLSRSLGGIGDSKLLAAAIMADAEAEARGLAPKAEEDSSDDDRPLIQLKRSSGARGANSGIADYRLGGGAGVEESSDEELPLAAIKAKRKKESEMLGKLDIDFSGGDVNKSPSKMGSTATQIPSFNFEDSLGRKDLQVEESDSDEDLPLGIRHPNGAATLKASRKADQGSEGSEDEDDKPLGAAHPQAAIIAEQAALIRQLQAEKEAMKTPMMGMPQPWNSFNVGYMNPAPQPQSVLGFGNLGASQSLMGFGGMTNPAAAAAPMAGGVDGPVINLNTPSPILPAAGAASTDMMPIQINNNPGGASMIPNPIAAMAMLDPKTTHINNWRSQVPPDATANNTPSANNSANQTPNGTGPNSLIASS